MKAEDNAAPALFVALAGSKILREYQDAFRKATGVMLKLVPVGECELHQPDAAPGNSFCGLVMCTAPGCEVCRRVQTCAAVRDARVGPGFQQIYCFAGLTVVAVPVWAGGRHVASLLSGQVFRREPTERDFRLVLKMLGEEPGGDAEKKLRPAYFATPVVTAERFQAIMQLVKTYAQYLGEHAGRAALAATAAEPAAVVAAKEFAQSHFEEPVRLAQVADHARVSPFHLCKLFKQATGMTVTDYVTRLRVEKAKELLADPSLRISEVVFAAGFGSIPRFNSAFKQHVGMPPTDFRAALSGDFEL